MKSVLPRNPRASWFGLLTEAEMIERMIGAVAGGGFAPCRRTGLFNVSPRSNGDG